MKIYAVGSVPMQVDMNFAEAVGHRNQRIVGPSLRELLKSRAK